MADKTIEMRIREHYCSNNGEWLVESGKVREARLLKEACECIERLRRQNFTLQTHNSNLLRDTAEKERELNEREKEIKKREARFEERKASFLQYLEKWV